MAARPATSSVAAEPARAPPAPKRARSDAAAINGPPGGGSRRDTLADDLARSDSVAEREVVAPTPAERSALSTFCTLSLQRKAAEAAARERVKDVKPQLKALRAALMRSMKSHEQTILQLPLALRRDADARASSAGLPPVPPYVRLVRNNKDLTITPDVINEVLRGLTAEDIAEADGDDGVAALLNAVVAGVRRIVRSYTEQIKLTESVPRGTRAADIAVAPEPLAREAIRLHERGSFVLAAERAKREATARVREAIAGPSTALDTYFVRGNLSHQRVVLEGQPYNVCRRVTVAKPKVTFKVLQDVLHEGIVDAVAKGLKLGRGGATKEAVATVLLSGSSGKRDELQRLIAMKLASLPTKSKATIHLQRVVPRGAAKDDGDDDEDDESEEEDA